VSPVKYEMEFYIPEDDILHSDCRENLKSYIDLIVLQFSIKEATDPNPCYNEAQHNVGLKYSKLVSSMP
jgi:hypothetical protein